MNLRFLRNKKVFIFTRFLLFSHKTPADFMNYLRFLAAFFILSVCFSCKTKKDIDPNNSEYVLIPDANFEKKLIQIGIDDKQDGKFLRSNAEKITDLDITNYKDENSMISSLIGLESFINLKNLDYLIF